MRKQTKRAMIKACTAMTAICMGFTAAGCGSRSESSVSTKGYSHDSSQVTEAVCEEEIYSTNATVSYSGYEMEGYGSNATSDWALGEYDKSEISTEEPSTEDFEWDTSSYSPATGQKVNAVSRKLIKNVSLSVETLSFDEFLTGIQERVSIYGGYVESMETWNNSRNSSRRANRDASMTIRIPCEQLNSFISEVGDNCNILSRSESVNDVTGTYTDYESRKTVLRMEEERLLTFMAAAESMEDILALELRLTEVQSEIERIEASLRTYDNLIAYSTIQLRINEVVELTPEPEPEKEPTFLENLVENFMMMIDHLVYGAEQFAYWIARNLIALLAITIVVIVCIHRLKKRAARKAAKCDKM